MERLPHARLNRGGSLHEPEVEINRIVRFRGSPETQEVLETIDFALLRELFEKRARRAGVDPKSIKFVEEKEISDKGVGAAYHFEDESLTLNGRAVLEWKTEAARVLGELCHEETHASAHNSHYMVDDILPQNKQIHKSVSDSGVFHMEEQREGERSLSASSKFRWFNEGITDEIGSEIFREYIQTKPLHDPKTGRKVEPTDYMSGYLLARLFVRKLTERISEQYDVPRDIAWDAVVHAYMTGLSLDSKEVAPMLDEIFDERFVARLGKMDSSDGIIGLAQTIRLFTDLYQISATEKLTEMWESFKKSRSNR